MPRLLILIVSVAFAISGCASDQPLVDPEFSVNEATPKVNHIDDGHSASEHVDNIELTEAEAAAQALAETISPVTLTAVDAALTAPDATSASQFERVTVETQTRTQIHEATGTTVTVNSVELSAAHAPWLFHLVNQSTERAHQTFFISLVDLVATGIPPHELTINTKWVPLTATGDTYTLRLVHEVIADGVLQNRIVDHIHGQATVRSSVLGSGLLKSNEHEIIAAALSDLSGQEVTIQDVNGAFFTSGYQLFVPLSTSGGGTSGFVFSESSTIKLLSPIGASIRDALQQGHETQQPFVGLGPAFPDCRQMKCVAFTFDDGPGPYTPALLDILKAHDVPATFFVLGSRVQEHPELTARIVADGHEVAGHSFNHPDFTRIDDNQRAEQFELSRQAMQAAGAPSSGLFRLPYGALDDGVLKSLTREGLVHVSWSIDPEDWRVKDPNAIALFTLPTIQASDIVLFHDIKEPSVLAMHIMVPWLKAHGFHFVTVSEMIAGRYEPGTIIYRGPPSQSP